ncbi:helix-turn-helix transcriptional regulator [Tenacibaculum amylolyticum]|uniref:helix-turn-helix transcriptional regulator n=1 Tax=Tenacibaculum amylolyticum TaxID=104269 RepID=UPI003895EED0
MIDRLKLILDYYNLTSSNFAEKIDVPRSSISHLLSGRNKPSLDFIIKVDKAFDEVELDWLLYGKGSFPKTISEKPSLFSQKITEVKQEENNFDNQKKSNNFSDGKPRILRKVILLYDDGTFDAFDK